MNNQDSHSEFSANDRDETIRKPHSSTKKSRSPERSFKKGEPLSREEMRIVMQETLNKGSAPREYDLESLDQSRDEDIYALTPSVQDFRSSTQKSRA
jgi:hypothetical protein